MHTPRIAIAAAALALIVIIGCSPSVEKPTITIVADKDSVATNGTVGLVATVTPTTATVAWSAASGTFSVTSGTATTWTAPGTAGDVVIKALATNDDEHDSATKTIKVYVPAVNYLYGVVEFDNIDQYVIPNPGTTYSPIRFPDDEEVPAGATVDSLMTTIDIDYGGHPDSFPSMNVWVESPDGSRVQIRNESQSGDPTGDYPASLFAAFRGKEVWGTWKLVVEALEPMPVTGVIDDFYLTIYYRYRP